MHCEHFLEHYSNSLFFHTFQMMLSICSYSIGVEGIFRVPTTLLGALHLNLGSDFNIQPNYIKPYFCCYILLYSMGTLYILYFNLFLLCWLFLPTLFHYLKILAQYCIVCTEICLLVRLMYHVYMYVYCFY